MALQDKTEPATQRRREEAREEGRVAKSVDVNSVVVMLGSLFVLKAGGPYLLQHITALMKESLGNLHKVVLNMDTVPDLAMSCLMKMGVLCLPIMLGAGAVGLSANLMQVGLKVTPKALAPDMSRIDPFKGLARLFSPRSGVELLKSAAKLGIVAYVVYSHLKTRFPDILKLAEMPTGDMGNAVALLCWQMLMRACTAMLIIAAIDYIYQRFQFENSLKMTKQEVKEEYKRSEGDPQVKGRVRAIQREMSKNRMMSDVPHADVVVTNPTHIAVALKYDPEKMGAPSVVAKGQRLLAEKIKALAESTGVPIVENIPVARLLYKTVEVGQQVPEELYQTVAEILAYVYRMGRRAGRSM
ncbi:MAG: flagellar biosynthesis protein FlhB [Armatimonadota bacterium]